MLPFLSQALSGDNYCAQEDRWECSMLLAIPEGEYAIRNLIRDKRIKFRRKTTYAEGKKKKDSQRTTHISK